jgi:hypothetical protein
MASCTFASPPTRDRTRADSAVADATRPLFPCIANSGFVGQYAQAQGVVLCVARSNSRNASRKLSTVPVSAKAMPLLSRTSTTMG